MVRTKKVHDAATLKRANEEAGHCYFSEETMRFFNSRISDFVTNVGDYRIFVSSEKLRDNPELGLFFERRYSINVMRPDGSVDNGRKEYYKSLKAAKQAAVRYSKDLRLPKGEDR